MVLGIIATLIILIYSTSFVFENSLAPLYLTPILIFFVWEIYYQNKKLEETNEKLNEINDALNELFFNDEQEEQEEQEVDNG